MYDTVANRLADEQHGIVAHWQLIGAAVDAATIRTLSGSRHWEHVRPTVLRRVGSGHSDAQALCAGVLACGAGAALSHSSAASWWGHAGSRLWPLDVIATTKRRCAEPDVHRREVRLLPTRWVTTLSGVPVVRPELAALHLFAEHRYERAERVTESLWSMRLLSGRSLAQLVDDVGRRGRNGVAGLRRYLEDRPGDYTPPATGIESRTMQILREAGIEVTTQVDLGNDLTWTGRVDFSVAGRRVVIEVQSERHHRSLVDAVADAERRRRLEAGGFTWVEVWDTEVWTDPASVVRKVRAALH